MKNDAIILNPEILIPEILDNWDYGESVKKLKGFVFKWKNITDEICRELRIARQVLSSQGKRTDLTSGKNSRSWAGYCQDIGVEKRTVNNWLALPAHVTHARGENEWYTPPEYIEAARAVMGDIDCDPASTEIANRIVKAKKFYSIQEDGLKQKWGKRIWMNPPYAQPLISDFCEAITNRHESGEIKQACIIVNNATETIWFQRILERAAGVCFIRGRVKFLDIDGKPGAPLQGQVIVYFGDNLSIFSSSFSKFGSILKK